MLHEPSDGHQLLKLLIELGLINNGECPLKFTSALGVPELLRKRLFRIRV